MPNMGCSTTYRWDLQRLRAIREHEELLRKYKMKSGQAQAKEKKREKLTTFEPKLYECKSDPEYFYSDSHVCVFVWSTCRVLFILSLQWKQ